MDRTMPRNLYDIITVNLRLSNPPAETQKARQAYELPPIHNFSRIDSSTSSTTLSAMARTAIGTTEGTGSQTLLETAPSLSHHTSMPTGTLRLRAVPAESRHIRWSEEVIDNEGLGRKKSKRNVPLLLPFRNHPLN